MKALAVAGSVVLVLSAVSQGQISSADSGGISEALKFFGPTWSILRFNLTPGSDLMIREAYTGCDPENQSWEVHGVYFLRNRTELYQHLLGGAAFAWVGAQAGVEGQSFTIVPNLTPVGLRPSGCEGDTSWGARADPNDTSLDIIVTSSAPYGFLNITATWTTGVTSWDIAQGPGVARTLSQFQHGVVAHPYGAIQGIGVVGAALSDTEATHNVGLGWFLPGGDLPPNDQSGVTLQDCRQNKADCHQPAGRYGSRMITSAGDTVWDFDIQATAQASEFPAEVIGIYDVPAEYFDPSWNPG